MNLGAGTGLIPYILITIGWNGTVTGADLIGMILVGAVTHVIYEAIGTLQGRKHPKRP